MLEVIAAITLVAVLGALDRSKQRAIMVDMRSTSRSIEMYQVDHGFPPDAAGGIGRPATAVELYHGNDMAQQDHWDIDDSYSVANGDYTLDSYGKDGLDGDDITLGTRFDHEHDIVLVNATFVAAPE